MCASLLGVEDDEMISEFLVDNLRQDGHAVTIVETVSDALVALRRTRTDIALIDVSLPTS